MPCGNGVKQLNMRHWILALVLSALSTFSALTLANPAYQTSDIPFLDNRFRVDFDVEEVTFIISRAKFKEPVILIRPDGSKVRIWDANEKTRWLEGLEHDIITIANPMAGPWQAVGDISGENRIRILSDVKLDVERLPIQLYRGERVRVTGSLHNQNTQLHDAYLRDTELIMTAHGYHRPQDDNFKFAFKELSKFNDQGERFDEVPGDGIFTTYLKLDLVTGKYRFAVTVKNNVFSRAFSQDVIVFPSPVKTKILPFEGLENPTLILDFDTDELDPNSIIVEAKVETKDHDEVNRFTLFGTPSSKRLEHHIIRPEQYGSYRVTMTLFATTKLGREIVIQLPDQAFVIPKPVVIDASLAVSEADLKAAEEAKLAAIREEEDRFNWLLWLIGGILLLIITVIATLFGIKFWQRKKFEKAIEAKSASEKEDEGKAPEKGEAEPVKPEEDLDLNKLHDKDET